MPWDIKEDLAHFKNLTLNHAVVMGRKTYESLPFKPLKNRTNIILTRNKDFKPQGVMIKNSLNDAIQHCKDNQEEKLFVIGGEKVYEEAMQYADSLEITRIRKDYEGDTYFPEIDMKRWKTIATDSRDDFEFVTYKKI